MSSPVNTGMGDHLRAEVYLLGMCPVNWVNSGSVNRVPALLGVKAIAAVNIIAINVNTTTNAVHFKRVNMSHELSKCWSSKAENIPSNKKRERKILTTHKTVHTFSITITRHLYGMKAC